MVRYGHGARAIFVGGETVSRAAGGLPSSEGEARVLCRQQLIILEGVMESPHGKSQCNDLLSPQTIKENSRSNTNLRLTAEDMKHLWTQFLVKFSQGVLVHDRHQPPNIDGACHVKL
jgi:hypothetical protein